MSFKVEAVQETEGSTTPKVDYDALNASVITQAGLQNKETLTGYISAIIDLGVQARKDAEVEFNGSPEDEAVIIEKQPNTYFKDGIGYNAGKRLRCWPQEPVQSVTFAVDFPDVTINRSEFFPDAKEDKPLRLYYGGEFYLGQELGMCVSNPIAFVTKNNSFHNKNVFYRMAVASKIISEGEAFSPEDIDKLVGHSYQFDVQVYMKPNAKTGKSYYTEYIKYSSGLARGMQPLTPVAEPQIIEFNGDGNNDEQTLKELRYYIKNTMSNAINYETSKIKKELDDISNSTDSPKTEAISDNNSQEGSPRSLDDMKAENAAMAAGNSPQEPPAEPDFDDDIPF